MNILFCFLIGLYLITVGFFIGASESKDMFSGIKWTDIGTLLVTFLGFCFGFITYFRWLNNKKNEDSYLAAKRYLASIDEIEEHLNEMMVNYDALCPVPGALIESIAISTRRIEHLYNVYELLYQSRRNLYKAHRELAFWNVTLTENSKQQYIELNKKLDSIGVICSCLTSQLHYLVTNDYKNMNEVINHKKLFNQRYADIHKITSQRVSDGFKSMFKFSQQ
ncbi:hypothetical protein ACSZOM_10055 [Aeromonas hydrophila]